jgi:hypothetical protein
VAHFKVMSQHLCGENEEKHKNCSVKIAVNLAEIRTKYLPVDIIQRNDLFLCTMASSIDSLFQEFVRHKLRIRSLSTLVFFNIKIFVQNSHCDGSES